jgi:glycerophosphoryl diester phosphodiesterase
MNSLIVGCVGLVVFVPLSSIAAAAEIDDNASETEWVEYDELGRATARAPIQVGQRPLYLVDGMSDSPLKRRLQRCERGPFRRTDFSIGHRGAPLQFPEHTAESYVAAARQGAGIVECDVTFTRDGELVCRHAQNDLHTTTNILTTPLAKSLGGKMDAFNPAARTSAEFLGGTAPWRTDLYAARGTLLSLRESLQLNQKLRVKHTPELKSGDPVSIAAVFGSQEKYALKLTTEMRSAGVRPRDAWPQSFNVEDVLTWVEKTEYGRQAVYLLNYNATDPVNDIVIQPPYDAMDRREYFRMLKQRGVRIIAPPIPALLTVDASGKIVPSQLARDLRSMGFDIITWSLERSDLRQGAARAGFYYDFDPQGRAVAKDSDIFLALDVLARDVRVIGIFSDWPATVTYYANCMGLK